MCHHSDFDHLPRETPYKAAEPGQLRKHCNGPLEAKFWREAQEAPADWMILPDNVVVFLPRTTLELYK